MQQKHMFASKKNEKTDNAGDKTVNDETIKPDLINNQKNETHHHSSESEEVKVQSADQALKKDELNHEPILTSDDNAQTNDHQTQQQNDEQERIRKEKELEEENLKIEIEMQKNKLFHQSKLASLGEMSAGIAHEINNPLASIAWAAESLESRVSDLVDELPWSEEDPRRADVEVIRKYLRRIQDESFRVKGITDGLLDFSRLGGTAKVETDLRELVDGVVEMVRHLARHRHKRLTIHGPSRLKATICPQSMKQVVLNLVTNALESVDENGHVDIHLAEERDQVILRVIDDGCGMSTEVLEHLFEPFFTRKRDQQGTGLGLSISHRIVTEHQGQITPRSAGAGLGSEFVVTLPTKPHVKKNETQRQAA